MSNIKISQGVVHTVPKDLRKVLTSQSKLNTLWSEITPLARNEWICWIESARLPETRARRIERTQAELLKGKKRPCCWAGCPHRNPNTQKWFEAKK